MGKSIRLFLMVVLFGSYFNNFAQQYTKEEIESRRCFVGSTAFMLMNFLPPKERPDFAQLNIGYRLTTKDAISLELKTWRYHEPIGIPYGDAKTDPKEKFPGYIREVGFAVAYQRFIWKGLYGAAHVMSAFQSFIDTNNKKIDKGFQIFNTYRIGYHIRLFKSKRFFIEPSFALTHRPYHTKMPENFKKMDDKWSKFFFPEPGLHFGFNF